MLVREKIKLLRHSRKWSQEYIAEKLGMSPNGYGALERGDSNITLDKLEKIAQLLDVPLSDLCDDGGNNVFNLAGEHNHNTTQFQINVYSAECLEIKHELDKQLLINELKSKEIAMKNDEIAGLKKIIALLENKCE